MLGDPPVPLKWRGQPPAHSAGTLYQFVRDYLSRQGGECNRLALTAAIEADPKLSARLANSQGLKKLLWNMHYSGWIEAPGDRIKATPKTRRRTGGGVAVGGDSGLKRARREAAAARLRER